LSVIGLIGCNARRSKPKPTVPVQSERQVSAETELAQLKSELDLLEVERSKLIKQLAEELVASKKFHTDVQELTAALGIERAKLLSQGEAIKAAGDNEKVTISGLTSTKLEAKSWLTKNVDAYQRKKKTLAEVERTLKKKEQAVDALQKSIESVDSARRELLTEIENLETGQTHTRIKSDTKYKVDDEKLAATKKSLEELRKKIEIQQERLKLTEEVNGDRGNPNRSVDDILKPVADPPTNTPKED